MRAGNINTITTRRQEILTGSLQDGWKYQYYHYMRDGNNNVITRRWLEISTLSLQ
jgi:hypothetical protein